MDKINAPRRIKCTLQSHSPSISVSRTFPSVRKPVGSRSILASEIEHHCPVVIKVSCVTMALMVCRIQHTTGTWKEVLEEAIRILMWDGKRRSALAPPLSDPSTNILSPVLEIKLESLLVTVILSRCGWVRRN